MILADLHWADAQVLEFIDELMERLGRLPYVVVGTARHAIHDRWSPRPGRHNSAIVHLEPLDREAALVLLDSLLGWEPDDELRDQLLDRAGGNPFFLEELVTLLQDTGEVGQPRSPTPPGDLAGLPDNLRGLIQARLDALTDDERSILEDAAILGRRGNRESLQIMAGEYHGIGDITDRPGRPRREGAARGRRRPLELPLRPRPRRRLRHADQGPPGGRPRRHRQVAGARTAAATTPRRRWSTASPTTTRWPPSWWRTSASPVGVPEDVRERALVWLERATDGRPRLRAPPGRDAPHHPDPRAARGRDRRAGRVRPHPPGPLRHRASASWTTPGPT